MALDAKKGPKFQRMARVLPDNPRSFNLIKEEEAKEQQEKEKEQAQKALRDREDKDKKRRERDAQKEREKRDKAAAEQAKKRQEEEEQSKKLNGRMLTVLKKLKQDETPRDYSMAGIDLGGPRTRILASLVCFNNTLTCLHLARKNIQDIDGIELARVLYNNKVLRKMELEGNCLGPKSAREFGLALQRNTTLRYLDLESNQLTLGNENTFELQKFFIQALYTNKTLLSLNIANNQLHEDLGKEFKDMLEQNMTLIDFEISFNTFHLTEVREIQRLLIRNNKAFNENRLREWRERKLMLDEDEKLHGIYLKEETKHEQQRMEEEAREHREQEIDATWKKYLAESQTEKQQLILQLMEAATLRSQGKKKGKKRGGKKKK